MGTWWLGLTVPSWSVYWLGRPRSLVQSAPGWEPALPMRHGTRHLAAQPAPTSDGYDPDHPPLGPACSRAISSSRWPDSLLTVPQLWNRCCAGWDRSIRCRCVSTGTDE